MGRPFDLSGLLAAHSERRIRIIDMLGRRGRSLTLAFVYSAYVYLRIASGDEPRFLTAALADGLLDAVVMSWFYIAAFHSNGILGRIIYGAPSRIMDGRLGRANLLSIVMLWNAFKFVMVPLSAKLGPLYSHRHYAALFGFIWISYQIADTLAEVVGCTIGKQVLPAWGPDRARATLESLDWSSPEPKRLRWMLFVLEFSGSRTTRSRPSVSRKNGASTRPSSRTFTSWGSESAMSRCGI